MSERWESGDKLDGARWDPELKLWVKTLSDTYGVDIPGLGIGSLLSVAVLPENNIQIGFHDMFQSDKLSATRERKYAGSYLGIYEADIEFEGEAAESHFDELEFHSVVTQLEPLKVPSVSKVIEVVKVGLFRARYSSNGQLISLNLGFKGDGGISIDPFKDQVQSIHDSSIIHDQLSSVINSSKSIFYNDRFYGIDQTDSELQVLISKLRFIPQEGLARTELASVAVPRTINFSGVRDAITGDGNEWLSILNKIPASYVVLGK